MKNKKIFLLFPLLILFTLAFSYFLSNNLKTEVKSEEQMYYDITHNPSFPKVDGDIRDMALNEDGTILYIGGYFTRVGDLGGAPEDIYSRHSLAAINTSDFSITDWNPSANDEVGAAEMVFTIEVYGDSIYVGGSFTHIGETYTGEFARITSNGTLDVSCSPNIYTVEDVVICSVYDVEIDADYIYVGGSFNRVDGNAVAGLVRLSRSNCSWDTEYVPALDGPLFDIEMYDGGIYIGGGFNNVGETYTGDFAKLNPDGSPDIVSCNPNIHSYLVPVSFSVHEITLTNDFIYVGGNYNKVIDNSSSNDVDGLIRLHRDSDDSCEIDRDWNPTLDYESNDFNVNSITPIGQDLLVGGVFDRVGSVDGKSVAIVDGDTAQVLPHWNPEISWTSVSNDVEIHSTLVQNNKIYIGGNFDTVGEDYPGEGYSFAQFSYQLEEIPNIEIRTIEDLSNIKNNLFANYTLMNDLDFNSCTSYSDCINKDDYTTGLGWDPVGYFDNDLVVSYPFYGVFDGQGYEISNLYINRAEPSGLFGLNYGTIKDLKVVDVNIELLAEAEEMTAVGAIVANNHGTISNCYASGQVSGEKFVGGLVGYQGGATIENSSSSVSVTGLGEVGGLVGASEASTISNSYATGDVTGVSFVGGLAGYSNDSISNSFSIGLVTASSYFGGLVGEGIPEFTEYSYWNTQTSGVEESTSGGIGLTTTEMKTLSSFSDWDIVAMNSFNPSDPSIWYISDGQDYPRLYWEYEAPDVLTKEPTNFTINGATLNGELLSMDGETEVGVYFRYRQGEGAWITVDGVTKTSSGVFSSPITGLTLNTQYQYQAVVTWRGVGTEYGNIVTFSTPETPPLPTVFGTVVSNIEDIQTPTNTESPLVLTKIGTGSITFPSGLNLVDNYEQLSNLSENLVILYEPSPNRFRAYVNSNGASFLASHGATIRFFNVRNQLGISGLTSSNFKTLLKVSVLNDSKSVVTDTSSYFDWNNASYNQDTDILTMPVNHFSEYVLGVNTGVLPSTGMSSLTMLIPLGLSLIGVGVILFSKKRYKKI